MKITPRHEFLRDMDDRLFDRESIMPLILGLVVNLILCVVVVPTSAKVLLGDVATAGAEFSHDGMVKVDAPEPPHPPEPPIPSDPQRVPLGNDDPGVAEVAWISYDDYQALIAPTAETVQPALQQMVDPVPEAPHRVDATPPVPPARDAKPMPEAVRVATAMPDPVQGSTESDPLAPSPEDAVAGPIDRTEDGVPATPEVAGRQQEPVPELEPRPDGQLAILKPVLESVDASEPDTSREAMKQTFVTKPLLPARSTAKRPITHRPASDRPATPTASPRSDRESPPVDVKPDVAEVRVGRVFTAQGVQIKPAVPRISVQTTLTSMRGGIRVPVTVTFDPQGRVVAAKLNRRTGYPEIDSPIRASLYRWKASGKQLAVTNRRFDVSIDIIIPNRF